MARVLAASAQRELEQSSQQLLGMSQTYHRKTTTEVNPRSLQTPCSQMDLVSRLQPAHYCRKNGHLGLPWDNKSPEKGGNKVPSKLHDKPFNAYGSPVRGPKVDRGMLEREPEDQERTQEYLFRGERRSYIFDDKGSRKQKHEKYAEENGMFALTPHSEQFCSRTLLCDRWPTENGSEALYAPKNAPENIATRKKYFRHRQREGLEADLPSPQKFHDPNYVSPTKYGLYHGIFDKPGTKAEYLSKPKQDDDAVLSEAQSSGTRMALHNRMSVRGAPAMASLTMERFRTSEDRLARPRWGIVGSATTKQNESLRRMAAHQRSYDLLRPRNNLSCPELGYHYTHR